MHGWDGNPHDSWKPWLRQLLEKRGWEWIAPQFPGGEHPQLKEWLANLQQAVGTPDKKTYFIGHSLGCIAILKYLESLPADVRAGGAVLVAGFVSDINIPEIANFTQEPLDAGKVKRHADAFKVIGSRDDDAVPFGKLLELQHAVGAQLIIDNGKGHFSEDDNVKELPSLLEALMKVTRGE